MRIISNDKSDWQYLKVTLKALLLLLFAYTLFRLLFIALYNDILQISSRTEWFTALTGGLRFDISAIVYINILFIFLSLQPLFNRNHPSYLFLLRLSYLIPNLLFLLLSIVDLGYYRHTQKRSSIELVGMLGDLWPQLYSYLYGYWFLFLLFIIVVVVFYFIARKIIQVPTQPTTHRTTQYIIFLFIAGLWVLGARGGIQLKPITPINAADYLPMRQSAAVLSTPFVFLQSIMLNRVTEISYMPTDDAESLIGVVKKAYPDSLFQHKNVIVFILESFNREWIGNLNNRTYYTPFLDSICSKSFVCTNGYANAKHSNEGIPAILASLPSMMNESIISSQYQSNIFQGFGNIFKSIGYSTSFFHGARNGSFNFNQFANSTGFDTYYGMDQYPDKSDFDGYWGIWDHRFMKYFGEELDRTKQPFASVFFNISSHYPYSIPKEFQKEFKDEPHVNQLPSTVRYVDFCLQQFFEKNKNKPWFNNTLFVFCADHTGEGNEPIYKTPIGIFRIPIIFYDPSNEKHVAIDKPVMQVDVLPSILDYLKVPVVHFSLGHSMFDNKSYPAYQYHENYYQVCNDSMLYFFDENKIRASYNFKKDPLLEHNLLRSDTPEVYEITYLKAALQVFRSRLINNRLIP